MAAITQLTKVDARRSVVQRLSYGAIEDLAPAWRAPRSPGDTTLESLSGGK